MPQDPLVLEITDAFSAFIAQLRACADITALTANRIADRVQEDWTPGAYAVIVRKVGGDSFADIRHQYPLYDVWALGSSGVNATRLFRRIQAWLVPHPSARPTSFKIGAVVVYSVDQSGGQSYRAPDQESPWHAVIQAYRLDVSEVPL